MISEDNNPFESRTLMLAHGRNLEIGPVSRIMGILNVTPDSFSDGGKFVGIDSAIDHAAKLIEEGADIIDVGGETTKPGAKPINQTIEQDRILPIIVALHNRFDVVISIDTYRSKTAAAALDAGAHMVNDVGGLLFDEDMAPTIASYNAGVCIMHNSRDRQVGDDIMADQLQHLDKSISIASNSDIKASQIVLDPGFGFGKTAEDNLLLLGKIDELHKLGLPLLIGTSRKRFTGSLLGDHDNTGNRDIVTAATSVMTRMAGCAIFRVHDVKTNKIALKLADSVINTRHRS